MSKLNWRTWPDDKLREGEVYQAFIDTPPYKKRLYRIKRVGSVIFDAYSGEKMNMTNIMKMIFVSESELIQDAERE